MTTAHRDATSTATRTISQTVAVVAFLWAAGFVGASPASAQHGHHHGHGHHGHYGHGYYGHGHHYGHYHGYYPRPVVVVAPRPVYVAPPPPVHYHPEYHIDGIQWTPGRGIGLTGHVDAVPHYGW